jgi:flagellar biosynthesis regulator FlbT
MVNITVLIYLTTHFRLMANMILKLFKDALLTADTKHGDAVVHIPTYECVFKSFRTSRLERELQMVQLSATKCSCIAIL